jgi:hypothetical protein
MVLDDPLMRRNVDPTSVTRPGMGGEIVVPLMRAEQTFKRPVRGRNRHKAPPPGRERWKHPTKATKLELLRLCALMVATDIWSVANRFNMSYKGAEVKLWRLTKQGILKTNPECDGTKTWWLTPAGHRALQYLENTEQYGGGTKGMIIGRLQAETKQLKKQISEASGIVNKNVALEQALADARKEIGRLKAENRVLHKTLGLRPRR